MLSLPVHEEAIEESTRAVENAADCANEREKVVVGDETLTKSFVKPGHWQSDHVGAEPGGDKWQSWHQEEIFS